MTASQLSLYNEALRRLGERKLSSLSEARESRRVLDSIWDADFRNYCLEQAEWNFAIRQVQIDYSTSVDPAFGFQYAFDKPTDWLRTTALSSDEYFTDPLLRYQDDGAYWFADETTLYVRYVSNDSSYGTDYSKWTPVFTRYAATHLAAEACMRIAHNKDLEARLEAKAERFLRDAQSKDSLNSPAKFPPRGSWVRARMGGGTFRYDRAGR